MGTLWKKINVFVTLLTIQGILCLRGMHVIVPDAAARGSRVELKCIYDLELDVLYSVQWYRGGREFCRYTPSEMPVLKVFDVRGIEVIKHLTDAHRLTIVPLSPLTAQGTYVCEVTADYPSFQSLRDSSHMYIVELPKHLPEMLGMQRKYRPGMTLNVQCISRNSIPAANLSFFINDKPALSQHVLHRVDGNEPDQPMTAFSTIQFVVRKHHFVEHKMRIRCTAFVYSIYTKSLEKVAMEVRDRTTTTISPKATEAEVYLIHHDSDSNLGTPLPSLTSDCWFVILSVALLFH